RLDPYDSQAAKRPPSAEASSNPAEASALVDGDPSTVWRSIPGEQASVTLDFHQPIEQGGIEVLHAAGGFADAYCVDASFDGTQWQEVRRFTRSDGGSDPVYMPDVFARYV